MLEVQGVPKKCPLASFCDSCLSSMILWLQRQVSRNLQSLHIILMNKSSQLLCALTLDCTKGCWKIQIFGYQGLPNASVIWVFYQNRSTGHKEHPQALKSGCWGSYHNKFAKGHFFGTPCMLILQYRLQPCIATINRWTDYCNNREKIVVIIGCLKNIAK